MDPIPFEDERFAQIEEVQYTIASDRRILYESMMWQVPGIVSAGYGVLMGAITLPEVESAYRFFGWCVGLILLLGGHGLLRKNRVMERLYSEILRAAEQSKKEWAQLHGRPAEVAPEVERTWPSELQSSQFKMWANWWFPFLLVIHVAYLFALLLEYVPTPD